VTEGHTRLGIYYSFSNTDIAIVDIYGTTLDSVTSRYPVLTTPTNSRTRTEVCMFSNIYVYSCGTGTLFGDKVNKIVGCYGRILTRNPEILDKDRFAGIIFPLQILQRFNWDRTRSFAVRAGRLNTSINMNLTESMERSEF